MDAEPAICSQNVEVENGGLARRRKNFLLCLELSRLQEINSHPIVIVLDYKLEALLHHLSADLVMAAKRNLIQVLAYSFPAVRAKPHLQLVSVIFGF